MNIAKIENKAMLTDELKSFIKQWQDKPGNLIMILHQVQEYFGYVPRSVAFELMELLDVPLSKIYGVITFYHFFKLKKPGKNQIAICLGTACYLKGGQDLVQEFEDLLGVGVNQVTSDGEFSFETVRCIGCCGLAPVIMINGEVYGNLKKEDLPAIIAKYKAI